MRAVEHASIDSVIQPPLPLIGSKTAHWIEFVGREKLPWHADAGVGAVDLEVSGGPLPCGLAAASLGTVGDLVPGLRPYPAPGHLASAVAAWLGRQVGLAAHLRHALHLSRIAGTASSAGEAWIHRGEPAPRRGTRRCGQADGTGGPDWPPRIPQNGISCRFRLYFPRFQRLEALLSVAFFIGFRFGLKARECEIAGA